MCERAEVSRAGGYGYQTAGPLVRQDVERRDEMQKIALAWPA